MRAMAHEQNPHPTHHDDHPVTYAELVRRVPSTGFAPPLPNPAELPLRELEPAVLERLAAELVNRHDHRGVQFYGRSGQAQHGLDVVELRPDGGYTLYQVRRYQELTPAKLRNAVEDYAGAPRAAGHDLPPRRFGADRFVVLTSAALDADTANVDVLAALRREYAGDVDIDVWGSEAVSRKLREVPRVVHAVFGAAWAKEFCAFEPAPQDAARPQPLGLVEQPAEVLGLDGLLAEAADAEPARAAVLYRTVADALADNGFPGHAALTRRREAQAALEAGHPRRALEAMWPAAVRTVARGEALFGDRMRTLRRIAEADGFCAARVGLLLHAEDWKEHGSDLGRVVPLLIELAGAGDPGLGVLACLALEGALADGLFEFDPPRSVIVETSSSTAGHLAALVAAARAAAGLAVDPAVKARLVCALADSALPAAVGRAGVEAQYGPLLTQAAAGRHRDAAGLIAARAARAFALHGDPATAEDLWRRAVLSSSESGLYGDARAALRSMTLLDGETGTLRWRDLPQVVEAMPDRRRLVEGGADALLHALAQAHDDKLPDAFGHARHALLVAMVSGDLSEELEAVELLGDVLDAAGHPGAAVECWVVAGRGKKAARTAAALAAPADVARWLRLPWRRRSDAAAQVVGAQADLVKDADAPAAVDALLDASEGLWGSPWMSPHPELSALKALGGFAGRLAGLAVDRLLSVCEPAVAAATNVGRDAAPVLFWAYWWQPQDRERIGLALARMLGQDDPPDNAWDLARQLKGAHEPLLSAVQGLADAGRASALLTLAEWGYADRPVQQAARRACSGLLRRPIVGSPDQGSVTTQDDTTVRLLQALLDADPVEQFDAEEFSEARAWTAGGLLMSVGVVVDDGQPEGEGTEQDDQAARAPTHEPDTSADAVARLCAGPPAALAEAVATHLMDTADDRTGLALVRAQPLLALVGLLGRVETATAAAMAPRLLALHRDPGLTETDLFKIRSDVPLSRFRVGGGAADLAPAALLAAAQAVSRAAEGGPVDDALRAVAAEAVGGAIPLLRSDRHAGWAARAISAIAGSNAGQEQAALLLATHDNDTVRQIGAHAVLPGSGLLPVLAADRSAAVRRVLAGRADVLDAATAEALSRDANRSVRIALARAASTT